VRGSYYLDFFKAEGWTVRTLDAAVESSQKILEAARGCAWIVLIKVPTLRLVRALTKTPGAVVVFDLSDALWMPLHRRAGWHDLERILHAVDGVFCENEFLAPFARRFNARVFMAPTSVPLAKFDRARESRAARIPDGIVAGWVGSRTTIPALEKIRGPLKNLLARHPALEIRVLGASRAAVDRALGSIPCTVFPEYDERGMIEAMLSLDIGMYPEPFDAEDYAARGPLKALLYMAAGLPVVCAPGGECSRLFEDGVNGMLAAGSDEWEAKLEALIASVSRREAMGRAALDTARATQRPGILYAGVREALSTVHPGQKPYSSQGRLASAPRQIAQALRSAGFRILTAWSRGVRLGRRLTGISAS
jgi:glycosyltransferase involved in cell wall biosynthesis